MSRIGICLTMSSGLPLRTLMGFAKQAEERGFSAIFTNEIGMDAMGYLTGFGQVAPQIQQLGSCVAVIFLRHPVQMAASASVADDLTGGRIILGLGIGHRRMADSLGLPMERPLAVMREYVTIVKQLLRGETVNFEGKYYQVRGHRLSAIAGRRCVPVHLAVLGVRSAELAGEVADGAILNLATVQHTAHAVGQIADGAKKAGRTSKDVEVVGLLRYIATERQDVAFQSGRALLGQYGSLPFYRNMWEQGGFGAEAAAMAAATERGDAAGAVAAVSQRMVEGITLYGPRDRCWERVNAYRDAGVQLPVIYPYPGDGDWEAAFRKAIDTFAVDRSH